MLATRGFLTALSMKSLVLPLGFSWTVTSTVTPSMGSERAPYLGREVPTFVMDFVLMNMILYAYIIVL